MDIRFDKARNAAQLGGEALVFHCHYYNCTLQAAIEDGLGDEARDLQIRAAADVVGNQLRALAPKGPTESRALAQTLFSTLGFGTIELGESTSARVVVPLRGSHYGLGWLAIRGPASAPVCHFAVGFVQAAVANAEGLPLEAVVARETSCVACGAESCTIELEVTR
jgi:hypothetical protein